MGADHLDFRYLQLPSLCGYPGLFHGFSTRRGGVSWGAFSSLNLSFEVGDDPDAVEENRSRLRSDMGIENLPLVKVRQVHGDGISVIGEETVKRPGFPEELLSHPADALVTGIPGVTLAISVADCVPILLFDPRKRVIAAVHAGWRSTAAGLADKVVRTLRETFGTRPEDCVVGIGPSIGICCYEVDRPVMEAFAEFFPNWEGLVRDRGEGRWHLDLAQANRILLQESGVNPKAISSSGRCVSCCRDLFFSHRRDGKRTGRTMGLIAMKTEVGQ
jgi:polyphenol oxidase